MIKAVIFDYSGVLAYERLRKFSEAIAKEFDIDAKELKELYCSKEPFYLLGQILSDEFWGAFIKTFNLETTKQHLIDVYESSDIPNQKVFDMVKKLKKRYKLGLVSNSIIEMTEFTKKSRDLSAFDATVFSSDIRIMKPDERIFEIILKELNLKPNECIFVDDRERNVKIAKELGWKGIVFKNAEQLEEELRKLGVEI